VKINLMKTSKFSCGPTTRRSADSYKGTLVPLRKFIYIKRGEQKDYSTKYLYRNRWVPLHLFLHMFHPRPISTYLSRAFHYNETVLFRCFLYI
jgi:hypothetical protein